MVEYICPKCYRIFNHKGNYEYHINKKSNCVSVPKIKIQEKKEDILENINLITKNTIQEMKKKINCPELDENIKIFNKEMDDPICCYCNKFFTSKSHTKRHMEENCLVRKRYQELLKIYEKQLEGLYIENRFLKEKYLNLFSKNHLFPFGLEKIIKIDKETVLEVIKNPFKGIPNMIEKVHFSIINPQFHNIKIPCSGSTTFEVYDGCKWIIETKENIINSLMMLYKDMIDNEIDFYENEVNNYQFKSYFDFSSYLETYLNHLKLHTELTNIQKKYCKSIYQKLYHAMDLVFINLYRKELFKYSLTPPE